MDYGKFQYEQKKKAKAAKASAKVTETKVVQVKIGTGEHDLNLKASNVSKWLKEGHRVKIDLYLVGRAKYSENSFKRERLERILKLIAEEYKTALGEFLTTARAKCHDASADYQLVTTDTPLEPLLRDFLTARLPKSKH